MAACNPRLSSNTRRGAVRAASKEHSQAGGMRCLSMTRAVEPGISRWVASKANLSVSNGAPGQGLDPAEWRYPVEYHAATGSADSTGRSLLP